MGEVVSLNQYRKQRERLEKKQVAAANRVKFGCPKDDVNRAKQDRKRDRAELDGKALRDPDDAPEAR